MWKEEKDRADKLERDRPDDLTAELKRRKDKIIAKALMPDRWR
jgi:hypothetical protein